MLQSPHQGIITQDFGLSFLNNNFTMISENYPKMKKINILALNIEELVTVYQDFLKYLCLNRKDKALHYYKLEDRVRCVAGGLLLKFALLSNNYIKSIIIEELTDLNGKPYLKDIPEFRFNISHSTDWVVLSYSKIESGIDIEKIDKNLNNTKDSYLNLVEYKLLENLDEWQTHSRLYDFWTIKESIMKASGLGFKMHPKEICIKSLNPVKTIIKTSNTIYHTQLIDFANDYSLAISTSEEFNCQVNKLSITDILYIFNKKGDNK